MTALLMHWSYHSLVLSHEMWPGDSMWNTPEYCTINTPKLSLTYTFECVTDGMGAVVQVIAWCYRATSQYLDHSQPSTMTYLWPSAAVTALLMHWNCHRWVGVGVDGCVCVGGRGVGDVVSTVTYYTSGITIKGYFHNPSIKVTASLMKEYKSCGTWVHAHWVAAVLEWLHGDNKYHVPKSPNTWYYHSKQNGSLYPHFKPHGHYTNNELHGQLLHHFI